jgi:WG containing repeat
VRPGINAAWTDRLFPIFVREGRSRKRYKAGYIDCLGNIVIPPTFQHAYPFRNGVATVQQNGLWGAINPNGEFVIPAMYTGPLIFTEGLASFSAGHVNAPYKAGVMSLTGEILIKPRYRSISHFSGGLACVYTGELYGYIDRSGNQVIPPFFEDARSFSEGVAAVKINGAWGYIHPDASTAIPMRFICDRGMAGPFREGRARVARKGRWGHINPEGKFVVEPRFDMAYEFSEGMAEVSLGKRTGYVNPAGELVVPPSFLRGQRFSEGLAAVHTGSGEAHRTLADACEIGFIDATGKFVITPRFFIAGGFQGGLCLTETEKDLLYVDRTGEPLWRSGWVELGSFDPYHLHPYQA